MNNVHEQDAERLEGVLDSAYLFSYAFFMFFRYKPTNPVSSSSWMDRYGSRE
jgi:hypothetical protein